MVSVVESVQIVLFLNTQNPASALDLFQIGLGGNPSAFQAIAPEQSQASQSLDGADLTLFTQPGRVDFVIQPPGSTHTPGAVAINNVATSVDVVFAAIAKIGERLSVGRTATVAQGHSTATDAEDALAKVRAMVPGLPTIPGTSETTFQVALRKPSAIAPHRMIKRMIRWETAQMQYIEMQIGAPVPPRVITQGHMAHKFVDVFSENMEPLTSAQVSESAAEVTEIALRLLTGSFNDVA